MLRNCTSITSSWPLVESVVVVYRDKISKTVAVPIHVKGTVFMDETRHTLTEFRMTRMFFFADTSCQGGIPCASTFIAIVQRFSPSDII